MPDYYLSRIVSGSYLRPGLLLGSAGLVLGAALLLFLAADNGATAHVAWPAPTQASAGEPTTKLNSNVAAAPTAKGLAGPVATGQPPASLPGPYPAGQPASLEPAPAAQLPDAALVPTYTASVGRSGRLVQHSWDTIKAMFR